MTTEALYPLLKFGISAVLIVAISEIGKRNVVFGGLLASLPLISYLAFIWLYWDTGDTRQIADLSMNVFWLVLPSLVLFVALAWLLRRGIAFVPALGASTLLMLTAYGAMLLILRRFGSGL